MAHFWPKLAILVNFDQKPAPMVQVFWQKFGQFWSFLAKIGQNWPNFGQFWRFLAVAVSVSQAKPTRASRAKGAGKGHSGLLASLAEKMRHSWFLTRLQPGLIFSGVELVQPLLRKFLGWSGLPKPGQAKNLRSRGCFQGPLLKQVCSRYARAWPYALPFQRSAETCAQRAQGKVILAS